MLRKPILFECRGIARIVFFTSLILPLVLNKWFEGYTLRFQVVKTLLSNFGCRIYCCPRIAWKRIRRLLFFLWNIFQEMNYFSMLWIHVKVRCNITNDVTAHLGMSHVIGSDNFLCCVLGQHTLERRWFQKCISAVRTSATDIFNMLM
jgi:hypothetical protein